MTNDNNEKTMNITEVTKLVKNSSNVDTSSSVISNEILQHLSECVVYHSLLSQNVRSVLHFLFEQNKLNDNYILLLDDCIAKHNIALFCDAIINPPENYCVQNTYDSINDISH